MRGTRSGGSSKPTALALRAVAAGRAAGGAGGGRRLGGGALISSAGVAGPTKLLLASAPFDGASRGGRCSVVDSSDPPLGGCRVPMPVRQVYRCDACVACVSARTCHLNSCKGTDCSLRPPRRRPPHRPSPGTCSRCTRRWRGRRLRRSRQLGEWVGGAHAASRRPAPTARRPYPVCCWW